MWVREVLGLGSALIFPFFVSGGNRVKADLLLRRTLWADMLLCLGCLLECYNQEATVDYEIDI